MSTSEYPFALAHIVGVDPVTVYITVPAPPTTETVTALSQANSAIGSAAAITSDGVTVTVTSSIVSTQTISVVQATPPAADGIYSFTVDNDTTSWFGGQTPPSTASLISSTAFITLEPVFNPVSISTVSPSQPADSISYLTLSSTAFVTLEPVVTPVSTVSQDQSADSTSYLTLHSTSYLTLFSTMVTASPSVPVLELVAAQSTSCSDLSTKTTSIDVTVTETLAHSLKSKPSVYAGLYFGQARNGWNATMTTLLKSKDPINLSSGVAEKGTALQGTSYPKETCASISARLPKSRNGRSRLLKPRQVGGIVVDTIDGQVVSWTNEYDGQTPSTLRAVETPLSVSMTVRAVASHPAGKYCTSYPICTCTECLPATHVPTRTEATYTLVPVTATAPAFGPYPPSERPRRCPRVCELIILKKASVLPPSEAGQTIVPVTATVPASEPVHTGKCCG